MKKLSQNTQRFLLWLTIIIVGLIGIDFSIGLLNDAFFKNGSVRIDAIEHLILDADEDVIIMGNSAAACHFDAAKMEKTLGLTCFNGGTLNSSLKFNLLALKGLVNHHHPRLIILAMNPGRFSDNSLGKTSMRFTIYYGKAGEEFNRAVDEIYPNRSKFMFLNIARTDQIMLRRIAYKSGLVTYPFEKGYQPLPDYDRGITSKPLLDSLILPNPGTMQDFEEFISITRRHNIHLLLILTPNCIAGGENDAVIKALLPYADGKNVTIWNDTHIFPMPKSARLFFDLLHLNERGAGIYTDSVCRRLAVFPPLNTQ